MSLVSVFVVFAGAAIDLAAAGYFLRGRKETSPERIETLSRRARALAAVALLLGVVAPVVGVVLALKSIDSVDPQDRVVLFVVHISEVMNGAILGLVFAVPSLIVALLLMRRSRALKAAPRDSTGIRP